MERVGGRTRAMYRQICPSQRRLSRSCLMLNLLQPKPTTATTVEPATSTSVETDLGQFGYTTGCPACQSHRAGLPMSGQGLTVGCWKRLEDATTTDRSTATRVKATRARQAERIIKDLDDSGAGNRSSASGSGQHKRVRFSGHEHLGSNSGGD